MRFTEEQIRERLIGKHVLIVEDEKDLAKRLAELFHEITGQAATVVHTMECAREVMNDAAARPFDLVVMDVMLPKTRMTYKDIDDHLATLDAQRTIIAKIGVPATTVEQQQELVEARAARAQALAAINDLIRDRGGIELIEEWRSGSMQHAENVAVLYLTAIGNEVAVNEGLQVARGPAAWLVKPVASGEILQHAAELVAPN